ncbi:MAG: hypothetical protein M1833_000680 [Piccolia ochrophora]|nr:MAG: hypothetical protein M1833_000680 [Piccolia ochrophora]
MVTSTQTPSSSTATPTSHNGCFDPLDVDSFINYDQLRCPSPSLSPSSSRSQLSARASSATANPNNTLLPPSQSTSASSSQQSFAGPSHQYDMFKQQTGLPVGALANTLAVNQPANSPFGRSSPGFNLSGGDSFFGTTPEDELIDFGSAPRNHSIYGAGSEMDLEFDSPSGERLPAFFFPEGSTPASTEFVNPNAIGGQELSTPKPESATVTPGAGPSTGRVWPGMHQEQAAKAKAQAQIQKHQQHSQPPQRQESPQSVRQARIPAQHSADPIVEERISRLLNSMRQASVTGSSDDGKTPNGEHGASHVGRMRKDEEDMDEDERLLASEEGKKLSSKERRQLRNKVSARAFRSRRKEYIGQLEAELAAKSNEANDLRSDNRALMEENTRLSDLTRMLLSSPAFSTFLDTLSAGGGPLAVASDNAPVSSEANSRQEVTQASTHKDVNPHAVAQQQFPGTQQGDAHIGMTFVPDSTVDFSALDLNGNNAWGLANTATGIWGANQPQVFAVTEVPEGPAVDQIDTDALSGKSSNFVGSHFTDECKQALPDIERLPEAKEGVKSEIIESSESEDSDESNPAFALYADSKTTSPSPASTPVTTSCEEPLFGLDSEKLFARYDLVPSHDLNDATMDRFFRICGAAEAAFQRLEQMTSHL